MQGDLISRSDLISYINAGHLRNPNELCFSENDIVEMIKNQPTAYDVENVVVELEEQKCEYEKIFNRLKYEVPNQATYYLGLHSGCEISERIVHNGGKE
jgi:c-di-GMP-related signal transduction protein